MLTDATGTWGTLTLLRETKRSNFTQTDVRFVASLTPILADGVRQAALFGDIGSDDRSETGSRGELVSRLFFDHHIVQLTGMSDRG